MTKLFQYAGIAASVVLIAFGIGAAVIGLNGRDRVATELAREQIVGTPDSTIPNQLVNSGSEAQAFAAVIRKHTLEATGGKTYAQMPQYIDASGKGTSDKAAAGKDPKTRRPDLQPGPPDLGHRDRADDGAEHGLLRREHGHLRDRHGLRAAADRHRLPGPVAAGAPPARRGQAVRRATHPDGEARRRRRLARLTTLTKENVMTTETTSRTIVVGYDGSKSADAAIEHAIDRAGPDGRLVLVHAYHVPADYIGASYYTEMQEDACQGAAGVLDTLERDCERLGAVEHERDISAGPAAPAIVRAAEAYDADEIVIGSRGVGRVRALLGSVAHDVLHRAQCPVTVIPERMVEAWTATPAAATAAV